MMQVDNMRYMRMLDHLIELESSVKVLEIFAAIYENKGIDDAYTAYRNILEFKKLNKNITYG